MINTKEVIQKYNNGSTIKDLALENGISDYKMNKFLIKNGVTLRTRSQVKRNIDTYQGAHRTHSLNEEYFNEWSNNMAYWLGFIYADGNVINKTQEEGMQRGQHALKIGLKDSDASHLEKFKKEIEYTGEVRIEKTNYTRVNGENAMCSTLKISSKTLVASLEKKGVIPNKSLFVKFPNIPEEFEMDFIRGYFDGDGSVGIQFPTNSMKVKTVTPQIRVRLISASLEFITKMEEILVKNGMKKKKISSSKRRFNTLYEICYSTKESITLHSLFYKDDSTYLDRKYKDFTNYIKKRTDKLEENKLWQSTY